jgi:uncharacterized HhH-GPD family protein
MWMLTFGVPWVAKSRTAVREPITTSWPSSRSFPASVWLTTPVPRIPMRTSLLYDLRMPERLYFTDDDAANALIANNPLALLIGFALDQQVTVPTAFTGPRKLEQRLGRLDAAEIAGMDPGKLEAVFREKPAIHRFPGNMAKRVQELCAEIVSEYGGDAARVWTDATDDADLRNRIKSLPGFGDMKVTSLGAVLAKRYGVAAAKGLVPPHPTLGDVDSPEALASYQAAKRAHKAKMKQQQ